jgi:hypothetical protein
MADKKISALTASTTPLAGTEVLPIVQGGSTVKVAVSNLTAGRSVGMQQANIAAAAGGGFANPAFIADDGTGAARIVFLGAPYAGVPANKPWLHSYQDIYVGSDAGTTFNVISGGTKTLGVDGSGNATVTGNFVPSTAAKGIDFSANTHAAGMTSELLNDYEEGTWTPVIVGSSAAGTGTYSTQVGRYTKIGRTVHFTAYVVWSAHTGTGNMSIAGLPFSSDATANVFFQFSPFSSNLAYTANSQLQLLLFNNSTSLAFYQVNGGAAAAQVAIDTSADVLVTGTYSV